jgi:hypothetical protein
MRRWIPFGLAILIGLLIGMGCVIDNRRRGRACPPSYHWNGARCVHNSFKGKHHGKHKKHKKHKKHR